MKFYLCWIEPQFGFFFRSFATYEECLEFIKNRKIIAFVVFKGEYISCNIS